MAKLIPKILYFILIVLSTFLIISYSEANKIEKFLISQTNSSRESDLDLIQTVALTYSNKKNDSYIYEDPLFDEKYELRDSEGEIVYSFNLVMYRYIEVEGKKKNNSLAIILNNLMVFDENKVLDDTTNPIIDIDMNYERSFMINDKEFSSSKERFQHYVGTKKSLLLFNYEYLKDSVSYINIKDITFKYLVKGDSYVTMLTLLNSDISDIVIKDSLGNEVNRELNTITSDKITLPSIDLNEIKSDSKYYYNNTLKKKLSSYNTEYVKNILLELLFVIPLTYFLFFHKEVMLIRERKKDEENRRISTIKEELVKKEEEKKWKKYYT